MRTSFKGKNLLPQGASSLLYEQFLMVWKITFTTIGKCYYFITYLCTLRNGSYSNECCFKSCELPILTNNSVAQNKTIKSDLCPHCVSRDFLNISADVKNSK